MKEPNSIKIQLYVDMSPSANVKHHHTGNYLLTQQNFLRVQQL